MISTRTIYVPGYLAPGTTHDTSLEYSLMNISCTALLVCACVIHRQLLRVHVHAAEASSSSKQKQSKNEPFIIACYWPDYRTYIDIQTSSRQILTDIILFSIEPNTSKAIDSDGVCCVGKEQYEKARMARRNSNSFTNLFVSVGGGGRSNAMKEITSSKEQRRKLIRELNALWYVWPCVQCWKV